MEAAISIVFVFVVAAAGIGGVAVPIIAIVWWANKQQKQRRQAWARVAHELGLTFTGGRIHGRRYGHPIQVSTVTRGSGKNQTTYTVVTGRLETPLDLGLSLTRHGFFNDLLQGSHDVRVGDPPFDARFLVQADEDHRVQRLLAAPLRRLLLDQLSRATSFTCSDQGLVIERTGATSDVRWLHWAIEVVSRATHHLDNARAAVPVASPLADHRHAWASYARARGLRGIDTPLCMWGKLDGIDVYAYAVRTGALTYCLEVRLRFARPLALGLLVQPKRTLDRLAIFFGSQDYKFGDTDFDDSFVVKVSDVEAVGELLDAELRAALLGLQHAIGPTTLFDEGLSVRLAYVPRDPAAVPRTVQHLTGVAELVASKGPQAQQVGPYR